MTTIMISVRLDENLLAEVDTYAFAKAKTRSEALETLLYVGLGAHGSLSSRQPAWEAKEVARIAVDYYRGMASMFEAHNWPERGALMLPNVERRVKERYKSVAQFVEHHAFAAPEDFQRNLPKPSSSDAQIISKTTFNAEPQRKGMRDLVRKYGLNKAEVCSAFAEGLKAGQIKWKNNTSNLSPETYADAVWRDGIKKGWLNDMPVNTM